MRLTTILSCTLLGVICLLPAVAQRTRSMYDRPPRLDDRPHLSERDWVKRGQMRPGRYGRWAFPYYGNEWGYDTGYGYGYGTYGYDTALPAPTYGWWTPPEFAGTQPATSPTQLQVGGQQTPISEYPAIKWGDVLYVSARDYFAALNVTAYWDETARRAVATLPDGRRVALPLGLNVVFIDDKPVNLPYPTAAANGIMMVPLASLSEALGVTVKYDTQNNTATLELPAAPTPPAPPEP